MPDVSVFVSGSIVMVTPNTPDARMWIDEHVSPESQWFGKSLAVEPRYVPGLLAGMVADGLSLD